MSNKEKYTIYKNWKKENNPTNWENGCDECGGKFAEDEVFIKVDEDDWEGVWCFHKGECWNKGASKLFNPPQTKTLKEE